jgi:putative copper export protein
VSADIVSVFVRTLALVCLFQAAGTAFFVLLFAQWLPRSSAPIQRLGFWAAVVAVPLLAAHQCLDAARMADGLSGLSDPHLESLAWGGSSGNATLLEMTGLGVVAFGLTRAVAPAGSIASTGAVLAACAAVLTGHTSVHPQRGLLAPLLAVHLLLVAFWFGALVPLIICCVRESQQLTAAVLRGFSAVAGILVPCIGIAGLTMALVLMPGSASWRTTYGSLVLAKIGAFGVLLALAAWNRWQALPGSPALRRSIAVEYVLMVAVLAATATMTTFYSPESDPALQ